MKKFSLTYLLVLALVFVIPFTSQGNQEAHAQQPITPTLYCVGGNGQPPCAPINSPTVSIPAGGTITIPGTSGTPGVTTTNPSQNPSPSIDPCSTESSVQTNNKNKKKYRQGVGGFIEQFIRFILWLIQLILGGGNIPLPNPTDPNPSIVPSPSGTQPSGTQPSPSVSPCPDPSITGPSGTQPSITGPSGAQPSITGPSGAQPSTTISPSVGAPTGGSPTTTTCGGSANTPSSPVTGYSIAKCEDFSNGLGAFQPYNGGGGDTVVGGGRKASQCTVSGGALILTQDADGSTCGGNTDFSQKYGYWEVRMRAYATGTGGGSAAHPVLILWPTSENYPQDGELDYFETDIGEPAGGFLHCASSAGGNCYVIPENNVDYSQWHVYGFEWTPNGFTGWIDGQQWYTTSLSSPQSSSAMHQTVQLDNLSGNTPVKPAKMEVDWMHMYRK